MNYIDLVEILLSDHVYNDLKYNEEEKNKIINVIGIDNIEYLFCLKRADLLVKD
ncbi:MAG: hypothetical protein PUB18_05445 [bacterium]|nr:hypothetical protein [bacterium]